MGFIQIVLFNVQVDINLFSSCRLLTCISNKICMDLCQLKASPISSLLYQIYLMSRFYLLLFQICPTIFLLVSLLLFFLDVHSFFLAQLSFFILPKSLAEDHFITSILIRLSCTYGVSPTRGRDSGKFLTIAQFGPSKKWTCSSMHQQRAEEMKPTTVK